MAVKPHHTVYQCHRCGKILREGEACPDTSAHPLYTCLHQLCPALEQLQITVPDGSSDDEPTRWLPDFTGVTVLKEFVSKEEEAEIVGAIDCCAWVESQSGRRKQVSDCECLLLGKFAV